MLLHLTDLSDEPLQAQIVRQIRAKILSGDLEHEDGLPSIRSMARDIQVSVITVQRAYEHLEREGLIHSRRGKGFYVTAIPDENKKTMAMKKLEERMKAPIRDASAEGLEWKDILSVMEKLLKDHNVE